MAKEQRKILVGRVTSDKMDKTIVVRVERMKRHPLYGKVVRYHKKYKAHDEENRAKEGDLVKIIESRPLSKEKRWALVEILESSNQ
ncbi:MAG: 30S ribosomal protein S17 [Chloroflexi bacterium]|nr:MAG: 30S ribosomal protein S17 [Chloroflexota bacterium]